MIMKMNMKVTLFFVVALFVFAHSASAQTTNIYLGNIDFKVQEDQLADMFGKFGDVINVKIIRDSVTGKSKGFGFVEMANAEEAKVAISALNGTDMNGKAISVTEARARQENAPSGVGNQIPCEGGKLILVQGKFGSVRKCVKDPVPPAKPADKSNEPQTTPKTEPKQTESPKETNEPEDEVKTITLYVGNLSLEATEDLLQKAFEEVGEVISVKIEKDKKGKPTGVAYIEMSAEDAENTISALHGSELNRKKIVVKKRSGQ